MRDSLVALAQSRLFPAQGDLVGGWTLGQGDPRELTEREAAIYSQGQQLLSLLREMCAQAANPLLQARLQAAIGLRPHGGGQGRAIVRLQAFSAATARATSRGGCSHFGRAH